jgi:hypothetical protein
MQSEAADLLQLDIEACIGHLEKTIGRMPRRNKPGPKKKESERN